MSIEGKASRGRPRDEQVTRAILDATKAILASNSPLTIEAVARQAHVSRPSIYKRWPTLALLLLEATLDARRQTLPAGSEEWKFPAPDMGSLATDLQMLSRVGAALFATLERGGVIQALLAEAVRSEEFARIFEENILVPDETQLRTIFEHAAERGEWPTATEDSGTDEVLILRALIANAIFERYILHRTFEESQTSRLAEILARGSRPDQP